MEQFGWSNSPKARLSQTRIASALAVLHPHPTLPHWLRAVATSKFHVYRFDLVRHAALTVRTRAAVFRTEVAHAHAVVVAEVQWRLLAARVSAARSRLQRNDPSSARWLIRSSAIRLLVQHVKLLFRRPAISQLACLGASRK